MDLRINRQNLFNKAMKGTNGFWTQGKKGYPFVSNNVSTNRSPFEIPLTE